MNRSDPMHPAGRREEIFTRIREALRVTAPRPFSHHGRQEVQEPEPVLAGAQARRWLPKVGTTPAEWRSALEAQLTALRADLVSLAPERLPHELAAIAAKEQWTSVAAMRSDPLIGEAVGALGLPVVWGDESYDRAAMESASAGVTRCDLLVAQTGTVVLSSITGGGRILSVLPPHHLVVARPEEIVPDLPSAFERLEALYGKAWPGMISFVSGPSRTGDIERILVLGAHGPKKLTVLLLA